MMSNPQSQIHFPMARKTDPMTSHRAARRHQRTKLGERRWQVLCLVQNVRGATAGELGRHFYERYGHKMSIRVASQTPQKRLPELEKLGLVRRGKERKCSDSGRVCITWWPVYTDASCTKKIDTPSECPK